MRLNKQTEDVHKIDVFNLSRKTNTLPLNLIISPYFDETFQQQTPKLDIFKFITLTPK